MNFEIVTSASGRTYRKIKTGVDAAAPWQPNFDHEGKVFTFTPTQTTAQPFGGTENLIQGQTYFGEYDTPQVSGASLTLAEIAKIKLATDPSIDGVGEKLSNKVTTVRDALTAEDTKYPTELAMRTELDTKVDKPIGETPGFVSVVDATGNDIEYVAIPDEVIESNSVLAGAAPAGAKWGLNTATGQAFYVTAGNWTAFPVASLDINPTVSDETGTNGAGLLVPTSPPTPTPDVGDVHLEIYDDVNIYFTAGANDWLAPVVVEAARDLINFADATTAADDATGLGGVLSTAARSDHKHAVQIAGNTPVDVIGFATVGSENTIGINNTDDTGQKIADKIEAWTDGPEQPENYVDGEVVATYQLRALVVPDGFLGDATPGEVWVVAPGTAATYPFTFPNITGPTALGNRIADNTLTLLSPFPTKDYSVRFSNGQSFVMSTLGLEDRQPAIFFTQDFTPQSVTIELEAPTGANEFYLLNGRSQTIPGDRRITLSSGYFIAYSYEQGSGDRFTHIHDYSVAFNNEITDTTIPNTDSEYSTKGITSVEGLDQWGVSRRMRRIFDEPGVFDYTSLNYADRTAVFIRNPDAVNGKQVIYGTGGAITLEVTNANGVKQTIAGQDTFDNIQPNEFAVFEKDGNTARLDILSGERVSYFDDYADAVIKAPTYVAYDGLAVIRDTGEIYGRKTTTNSAAFPADGQPNADWFRAGDNAPDPQSLILDNIEVGIRSSGTNAGSNISLTFVDKDGVDYPASAWAVSLNLVQYSGGTATIVTDKSLYNGTVGVGRNKQGYGRFYYTGENPNGLSAIRVDATTATTAQNVVVTYQGTNYNDSFAALADITDILYWTTSGQDEATDQAAYIVELTEYTETKVFSMREPDNTDPDYNTLFNWQVLAGQTILDTEVNSNTNEAELIAIKPKLERFGIGSTSSETVAYPGDNGAPEANKDNVYYLDETVGALPLAATNQDISISIVQANSTDTQAVKDAAKAKVTHYRSFDTGAGFIWVESESQTQITGNAVERTVIQANRGSVMSFGDFQFRVPSSGNSSLQYRVPSGVIAVSDFITKWSNQQGGASENAFGYNLSTSWAYFRLNGALNLTLHNSYQDAMFTANGWTYRVEVIVGSGWTNNRFSFTRWRQDGVKGDAGIDGVDGRSITTSHRSDGITPIGGTVYTLDHIIYEYSDSTYQDMGLLIAPASSADVLLGSYDSTSFVTTRTFTLPDSRTWQDVLDEFKFVYFLVGGNNLFTHEQTRMIHVDDLTVANRDISLTSYQDHGTNAYHMKFRIPFTNGTTITVDNDNSNMQVQRIKVIGIK